MRPRGPAWTIRLVCIVMLPNLGQYGPLRYGAAVSTTYDNDGAYLSRLGDVFGDPTRRNIFWYLRRAAEPLTASQVADEFGLHRTVARAHLEKLGEVGLLVTGTRRRAGGGRPAKTYEVSGERLEVMLPPRRYERLSRNLLRLIATQLDPAAAEAAAFDLGRAYGEQTAAAVIGEHEHVPARLAPHAVAAWMDESGYNVRLSEEPGALVLEVHNCVFSELAREFPDIVCPFDRGTMCGMLGVSPAVHRQTHALSSGDSFCRHEFAL
jgi:predicted ArsR family transcriptional regulator